MTDKAISLRAPEELIQEVDEMVRAESALIGLPVDRTGFILRAVRADIEMRKKLRPALHANDNAKGTA